MPTLAQISLNMRNTRVHRDLSNAHAMHQRVMSLLPDDLGPTPRQDTGTLYRFWTPPRPAKSTCSYKPTRQHWTRHACPTITPTTSAPSTSPRPSTRSPPKE